MSDELELTKRMFEMKLQGLKYRQIEKILADEGILGRDKQPLTEGAIKARCNDYRKKLEKSPEGGAETSHTTSETGFHTQKQTPKRQRAPRDLEGMKVYLEEYVRKIVQETLSPVPPPSSHTHDETSHTKEIQTAVQQEVTRLLGDIRVEQVQKPGRGGTPQTVKKTFSIPVDVWSPIEDLGGIASNHVTAALRIYIKLLKEEKE